jgi:hypothetical protein
MTCEDPSYGLILGLARTIRYEESIQFATLEVEDLNFTAAGLLVKVYEKFRQQCTQGVSHPECEFAIHKDVVHVGRFHWLAHRDIRPVLDTDDAPRILEVGKLDGRDPVLWRQKSLPRLGEDDVTVEVHYVGLNFRVGANNEQIFGHGLSLNRTLWSRPGSLGMNMEWALRPAELSARSGHELNIFNLGTKFTL